MPVITNFNKTIWLSLVLLLTLQISSHAGSIKVRYTQARQVNFEDSYLTLAKIYSSNYRSFKSYKTGVIDEIYKSPGSRVQAGEKILVIDKKLNEAALNLARYNFDSAKNTYDREKSLYDKGLSSREKIENLYSQYLKSEHELLKAEKNYEHAFIKAPFTGVISHIKPVEKQEIEAGKELFVLTNPDKLFVDLELSPEIYSRAKSENMQVYISLDDYNNFYKLKLQSISDKVLNDNSNIVLRALIDSNQSLQEQGINLNHGELANFKVILNSFKSLALPEKAILTEGEDSYIFKVENGKASKLKVSPGIRQNGWRAVSLSEDSLTTDSTVVIEGMNKLKDGYSVELIE